MQNKLKVLLWADAPITFTGYGLVCKNIWQPLHQTEKYDINQIAINYHGAFFDTKDCPWQLVPAKLGNPQDPYGTQMFLDSVHKNDYDLIWIINDSFIAAKATEGLKEIFAKRRESNKKIPKIIYYYPVDCRLKKEHCSMIEFADMSIAYAKYGYEETIKVLPELKDKIKIIHHGVNTSKYFPYSKSIIAKLKKELFSLEENDYLIVNVNRNTMRKQLFRTLLAFAEFRKKVPKSFLYLHTNPIDRGINLLECMEHLDLKLNKDVFFPPNYSPTNGYPDETLNQLMNCGDLFLTTSVGEGAGLGDLQAMACGIPFVGPDDSVRPEFFGTKRGYLYPTKEQTYIDLSGLRKIGLISDIVEQMLKVYNNGWKHDDPKVITARKWIEANDWSIIHKQWEDVIEKTLMNSDEYIKSMVLGEML